MISQVSSHPANTVLGFIFSNINKLLPYTLKYLKAI